MKIGVLTLPLNENYGGILQAFATQRILKNLGYQPLTLMIERRVTFCKEVERLARRIFRKLFREPNRFDVLNRSEAIRDVARKNTSHFIRENISMTGKIMAPISEEDLAKYSFDAFVVGSDQVWRRTYMQPEFYLGFCGDDETVRRIAFSASFGTDSWDFSPEETKKLSEWAKKFHAISVREDSGVELCRKHLGVHAEHLVDPTMLLDKSEYEKIIEDDEARGFLETRDKASRRVFSYILDETEGKTYVERTISEALNATVERILPTWQELASGIPFPPVSAWLRGIRDSEFVITDSFHGSALSIVFNKPFLAIGNAGRGMARFNSLLKMFGLGNRLLLLPEKPSDNLKRQILDIIHAIPSWQEVNARLSREHFRSQEFLGRALKTIGQLSERRL